MTGVKTSLIFVAAFSCLSFAAVPAHAQDEVNASQLRTQLQERDAAIIALQGLVRDLTERLERLERQTGLNQTLQASPHVTPPAQATAPHPPPDDNLQSGSPRLAVDEDAAQRALERTLVQDGALLLSPGSIEISPSFTFGHSQQDSPVISLEDGRLQVGSVITKRFSYTADLSVRLGLPYGSQLEVGVPYRWANDSSNVQVSGQPAGPSVNRSNSSFGSLRVGLAKTLLREDGWRPDVVGRVAWDTGGGTKSGDAPTLGGYGSLSGGLSLTKRSDPLVFVGSVNYRKYFQDAGVRPGDQFGFAIGTALAVTHRVRKAAKHEQRGRLENSGLFRPRA